MTKGCGEIISLNKCGQHNYLCSQCQDDEVILQKKDLEWCSPELEHFMDTGETIDKPCKCHKGFGKRPQPKDDESLSDRMIITHKGSSVDNCYFEEDIKKHLKAFEKELKDEVWGFHVKHGALSTDFTMDEINKQLKKHFGGKLI